MALVHLVLAWLVGLGLGACCAQPWLLWLAVELAGVAVALAMRRERAWRLAGAMLALAALGALRITFSPLHPSPLRPYLDGAPVVLSGVVAEAPSVRAERTELVLRVDAVGDDASPLHDAVLVLVPRESPYRYGDRLRVTGVARTPPSLPGFSYRDSLARRGIHGIVEQPQVEVLAPSRGNPVQAALIALADRAEAEVAALWPAPEGALMAGILLGREENIPERLLAAFDDSGTRHIIAISGFNISLLAGVLTSVLLTFLGRRVAAPFVIVLLAAYVALVGADPAVVRAGIMGALTLLAVLAGRPGHALTGLAASAFAMTAWRPWTLWEPSFQLSFAATLGLIVLVPKMEAWVTGNVGTAKAHRSTKDAKGRERHEKETLPSVQSLGEAAGPFRVFRALSRLSCSRILRVLRGSGRPRLPGWLREAVLVSLAAQIATLPITLGTFGRLSLVAPLANLLILPFQAAVMELGALATLLGLLWRPLGQLLAYLAWPFIAWTIAAVERLGTLPFAAVDLGGAGGLLPWLLYALATLLLWARATPERWRALTRHLPTKAVLAGLAAGVAFIWIGGVARLPDGRLHVTFLDVGQGDAVLIRTPDGKHLLVDGGPDPTLLPAALGRRLYPWQRTLDLLALTHPDEDHLAGLLPIARGYRAALVLDTTLPRDTPTGRAWLAALAPDPSRITSHASRITHHASRLTYPTSGTTLDLGAGARLQVLWPSESALTGARSDSNNNGLVLRLTWGRASFLLTGDLEAEGEAALLRQPDLPLAATVLKVAHHGSANGTTLRFLEAVSPQVAVISVGAGNRFGHPAPEVLARLEQVSAQVWRTDVCGDVEIVTDGERLWVRTGR